MRRVGVFMMVAFLTAMAWSTWTEAAQRTGLATISGKVKM